MSIANFEERAAHMNGKIKRCSLDQFFVVHVAGMHPRRGTVDSSVSFGRGHSHAAEKWMHRDLDSRTEFGHHALAVERDDLDAGVRKVIGQKTGAKTKAV